MSKEYNPENVSLIIGGVKIEGFSEGTSISVHKKGITSITKDEVNGGITSILDEDTARKVQKNIDNAVYSVSYDNERLCPICEGQNDYKVIDSVNGHPCEMETNCTECGHKDYWAYGWYEPKDEKGEFI